MSDYTAVAPPSNLSGGFDQSSAFADALQRARQIAAKINTPTGDSAPIGGTKRSLEDAGMERADHRETKKIAALNDPFGAQLAAMQHQRIGAASNAIITEDFRVPDKMVGLIIGRGGEQITRLQSDSDCKIQMAADSGGMPDRPCTLTGTKQSIEKAKDLILQIVNRGGSSGPMDGGSVDGHSTVEMMIPGGKVGLVIGKGGETIKSLQERAGVKMVMIQDGPQQTMHEKPLRITGEPQKCEYARQLVMDLITEKELENVSPFQSMNRGFHRNQMGTNEYGTSQTSTQEVTVPRQAVGVVIGKGGDMIKKIQQDSGARVQFHQDDTPGDRICMLTGSPEQIQKAQGIIHDLINSIMARDQQSMGRGRGRGRGFDDRRPPFGPGGPGPGGPGMGRGGPPGGNRGGPGGDKPEIQYSVPANKCGIVIGKGGETIRTINQQSGAHVELSRQPPPNPNEKIFIIRGTQQQLEHAKQLINEKIGGPPGAYSSGPGGPPGGYAQPNQQPPPPPQAYAPQGWGNAYQHWQNQSGTASDPSQSQQTPQGPQPDYSAAWVEYYRSLGMYREAEMIEQQARANQQAQGQQQPQAPGVSQPQTPTQSQQQQQQQQQQQYAQAGQQYSQTQQPSPSQPQAQQQFAQYGQYGNSAPGTGPAAGSQYSTQHPAYNYGYGNYPQQQYPAPSQ